MAARFRDRSDAGRRLAGKLQEYADRPDVIILALPRGGVPVAYEVARALGAPLDVFVVRKLGLPMHPEFAMGAIASGGVRVLDRETLRRFDVNDEELAAVTAVEQRELERRERQYRDGRPFPNVRGRTVILIDDGLATGATMAAAASALRSQGPAKLVVAVPVSSPETCDAFRNLVDDIVCAVTPEPFHAVGLWYDDFSQTTDEEVHELLARGAKDRPASSERAFGESRVRRGSTGRADVQNEERTVHVAAGEVSLEGTLAIPRDAAGVVLFAHGSGSSRNSPRNRFVAEALRGGGLGTLLVDLLTTEEEAVDVRSGQLRFDIGLLAQRLVWAIEWLGKEDETRDLRVGLFGASTGGGAALVAAAARPEQVAAVVSRGGRPDLAGGALALVQAPTLLIVGEWDEPVIELNEQARDRLRSATVRLEIVPRATHLFEEPGALEEVARLARAWFARHLAIATQSATSARETSTAARGGVRARGEDELRR